MFVILDNYFMLFRIKWCNLVFEITFRNNCYQPVALASSYLKYGWKSQCFPALFSLKISIVILVSRLALLNISTSRNLIQTWLQLLPNTSLSKQECKIIEVKKRRKKDLIDW